MEIQNEDDILKQMQAIQIEMADVLLDFCRQQNLTIWAGYGTLLGAVRHKGFIPWDDDMDFIMPREDFDRLHSLAETYSLPNPITFDCSRLDVIKVKNNNTTQVAISKLSNHENFGIWVDIWCLDSFPKNGVSSKAYSKIRTKLRMVTNASQMSFAKAKGIGGILFHTMSLIYTGIIGKSHIFNSVNSLIRKSRGEGVYANILLYSRLKRNSTFDSLKKYDIVWFNSTVMLPFDGREYPCPGHYDEVLTAEYGDYMTPVKGASVHDTIILDTKRPYKEVVKEFLASLPWYKRILYKI